MKSKLRYIILVCILLCVLVLIFVFIGKDKKTKDGMSSNPSIFDDSSSYIVDASDSSKTGALSVNDENSSSSSETPQTYVEYGQDVIIDMSEEELF